MRRLRKSILGIGLLLVGACSFAQNTTITATVVDSDGVTWKNGTWKISFNTSPAVSNISAYNINGVALNPSVLQQSGSMDNNGAFSVTVYNSGMISPISSSWTLSICPMASSSCGAVTLATSGTTMDITSSLPHLIPAPRFNAMAGAFGYSDTEAINTLPTGGTYWNVGQSCQRYYNGTTWACGTGPTAGVFSINAAQGAFSFAGNGVNCIGTTCTFTQNPAAGVSAINGIAGSYTFVGTGVSCSATTCTFNQPTFVGVNSINSITGPFTFTGSGVNCSGTTCTFTDTSTGITSIAWVVPSWLTMTPTPFTSNGTVTIAAATGQTSHQVLGTCGSATSFGPCALVAADLPPAAGTITTGAAVSPTSGYYFNQAATPSTAITYTLPTPALGVQICVKNSYNGTAADTGALKIIVGNTGTQSLIYNGAKSTSGFIISLGAGGDGACVVGISTTRWEVYTSVGSWTLN
jgi:hypothetical protein